MAVILRAAEAPATLLRGYRLIAGECLGIDRDPLGVDLGELRERPANAAELVEEPPGSLAVAQRLCLVEAYLTHDKLQRGLLKGCAIRRGKFHGHGSFLLDQGRTPTVVQLESSFHQVRGARILSPLASRTCRPSPVWPSPANLAG